MRDRIKPARGLLGLLILLSACGDTPKPDTSVGAALTAEQSALLREADQLRDRVAQLGSNAVSGEALDTGRRELELRQAALGNESPALLYSLKTVGALLQMRGQTGEALPYYERALEIADRHFGPHHPAVADPLNNLALALDAHGDHRRASALYTRAVVLLESQREVDEVTLAGVLLNFGKLALNRDSLDEARARLERALELYESQLGKEHPNVAFVVSDLAGLAHQEGRHESERPLLERALAITETAYGSEHVQVGISLNNLAFFLKNHGEPGAALSNYQRSVSIWEKALGEDHPNVAIGLHNIGELLEKQGELTEALEVVDRAIRIEERTSAFPEGKLGSIWLRARLLRALGRLRASSETFEKAIAGIEAQRPKIGGAEDLRALYLERWGPVFDDVVRLQIEIGDLEAAYRYAERSRSRVLIDQLASAGVDLRAGIPEDIRSGLEAKETEVERRLASLQRDSPFGRPSQALQETHREFRSIYSAIKNASPLWTRFATQGGEPARLSAVQRTLVPEGGFILIFNLGSEASHLLVLPDRGEPEAYELVLSESAASALGTEPGALTSTLLLGVRPGSSPIDATRRSLASRGSRAVGRDANASTKLAALFETLIPAPFRQRLLDAAEVVIVPDGTLHELPFEALVLSNPDDPVYWLDRGPVIRYAPSVTVLSNLAERTPLAASTSGAATVLSLSDPNFAHRGAGGGGRSDSLPQLPGTRAETAAILRVLDASAAQVATVLQGDAATEAALRAALEGKRMVHLATHGIADAKQGSHFAALALTPPPPGGTTALDSDGYLQLHEIYELPLLDVELAVLSACETNVGDSIVGEGPFALGRGFLAAGARRVIASHWQVDDKSTAVLMGRFFEAVVHQQRAGGPIDYADALWNARREVRARPEWSDPYYWAPFVLTGAR